MTNLITTFGNLYSLNLFAFQMHDTSDANDLRGHTTKPAHPVEKKTAKKKKKLSQQLSPRSTKMAVLAASWTRSRS